MRNFLILGVVLSLFFASCSQENDLVQEQEGQARATIVNSDRTQNIYLYKTSTGVWKYTTDLAVVGTNQYQVYGRAYSFQQTGTVPVYSAYNIRTGEGALSIDKNEIINSYNGEWKMGEMLGYAYDPYYSNNNLTIKVVSRPPLYMDWDSEMAHYEVAGVVAILAPYTSNTHEVYYFKTSSNTWKYTTTFTEIGSNEYQITGRLYTTKQTNTVPIYLCFNPQYGYALVAELAEVAGIYNGGSWTVGNIVGYGYNRSISTSLLPKNTTAIARVPLYVDPSNEMARFEQPETMLYILKN